MTELSEELSKKPGEKFGAMRREYASLRNKAGEILKQSDVSGRPFRKARARVARELLERQRKSDIDAVTDLPVRRLFEERLREEVERHKRFGHKLIMVILDLNDLKGINKGGYSEGDNALRTVADKLKESKREIDYAARYGGDEFVLLLVETPLQNIETWWERFAGMMEKIPYTVSAGATEVDLGNTKKTIKILSDLVLNAKEDGGRKRNQLLRHFPD